MRADAVRMLQEGLRFIVALTLVRIDVDARRARVSLFQSLIAVRLVLLLVIIVEIVVLKVGLLHLTLLGFRD